MRVNGWRDRREREEGDEATGVLDALSSAGHQMRRVNEGRSSENLTRTDGWAALPPLDDQPLMEREQ